MLSYDVVGRGRPVLLLHGGFATRRVFGYQLLQLSPQHRVIAPDLPGYGASPWDAGQEWFPQAVDGVVALAQELGAEAPVVVGWSLGGLVAREVVDRLPGSSLVLVGTSSTGITDQVRAAMEKQMTSDYPRYARTMVRMFTSSGASADSEDWLQDMALATGVDVAVASVARTAVTLRHPLPDGTVSVSGARDQIVAPSSRPVEGVEDVVFERSGHAPFLEEKDRFNELVARVAG
jgi:non-heme chloroperoxidase